MATSFVNPEQAIVIALGKLHPDYTISLHQPVNETYPYVRVTNGKQEVGIQIRLPKNHWSIKVLDRLVIKAIGTITETIKGRRT